MDGPDPVRIPATCRILRPMGTASNRKRGRTRRRWIPWMLAAVVAGALQPASGQAPDPGHRTWLWIPDGFPLEDLTKERLQETGAHGVSADPATKRGALDAAGIPYYIDQITGGGILTVAEATHRAALDAGVASDAFRIRPRCLRDPAVIDEARAAIRRHLAEPGRPGPAFISLRDEPSATRLLNPMDWCSCEAHCREAFATFLAPRWGGFEKVRAAWGLAEDESLPGFRAPEEDRPAALDVPSTEAARRRFMHGARRPEALVPWNDAREFVDATFAETLGTLLGTARELAPRTPAGILGCQMPAAFGGFDWERLLPLLDVVEPYDYGGVREIIRSLARPGTMVLRTYFPPEGPTVASVHELWHYFLRGDRGAIIFGADRFFDGNDPARLSPWGEALAPHLRRLRSDALAPWRRARPAAPKVAILFSMPSVRAHWMIDSRGDGASWPRRLTSLETRDSLEARTRVAWISLLQDLGLAFEFVTAHGIRNGILTARGFEALVLPRTLALSADDAKAIREWSASGRCVIADAMTGHFNSRLRAWRTPVLDAWFGIRRSSDEVLAAPARVADATIPYPVAEPDLKTTEGTAGRMAGPTPILIANRTESSGSGRRFYLNLAIAGYGTDRILNPGRAAWLQSQVRPLFLNAGIVPTFPVHPVDGPGCWPIETLVRQDGADLLVALQLNFRSLPDIPWERVERSAAARARVALGGVYHVHDLVAGEDRGSLTEIEVEVRADRPVILRLRR